jgi:hypothetical protein
MNGNEREAGMNGNFFIKGEKNAVRPEAGLSSSN